MGRPIYPHEMCDPDFAWLISSYKQQHPDYVAVESTFLPIVLLAIEESIASVEKLALPSPEEFIKDEPTEEL